MPGTGGDKIPLGTSIPSAFLGGRVRPGSVCPLPWPVRRAGLPAVSCSPALLCFGGDAGLPICDCERVTLSTRRPVMPPTLLADPAGPC